MFYKTLYLGLIIFYGIVVIIYIIASVIINSMVASAASNLKINMKCNHVSTTNSHEAESNTKAYLEVVANEVEITHQVREKLKKLEC